MADVFREIEEELQQERLKGLFRRYGPWVVLVILVALLGVGGIEVRKALKQRQGLALATEYSAATALGDEGLRLQALEDFARVSGRGYPLFAAFERARILSARGDLAAAMAVWEEIVAAQGAESVFAAAAAILAGRQAGDLPAAIAAHLEILEAPGAAYRPFALEIRAQRALAAGDLVSAARIFRAISLDSQMPSAQRQRAAVLLSFLFDQGVILENDESLP